MVDQDIKDIVTSIRRRIDEGRDKLETQFSDFAAKYPKLFEASCDKEFNMERNLDFMLQTMNQMQSNSLSATDATSVVYERLNEQYVPHLDST
jgi:hypothetical protein